MVLNFHKNNHIYTTKQKIQSLFYKNSKNMRFPNSKSEIQFYFPGETEALNCMNPVF